MYDARSKILIIAVAVALFLSTVVFALTMLNNEEVWEDLGTLFTYMAVFFAVFFTLNILLVVVTLRASRKAKVRTDAKRCTSCSSTIPADARSCPKCHTVQPMAVDENMYLRPRSTGKDIKPKK